jgi:transcriptional regulator with XRE-family HTH domain
MNVMAEESFIKEDLIDLRNSLGLTQQQMAEQLGLALRSYQAIESGESPYRYIHRLAAERVALMLAVDKQQPELVPDAVRKDAVDLVRLGQQNNHPAFRTSEASHTLASSKKESTFRSSYGTVGELVLITSALDHQLNHVLMQVLHLVDSPMLESVVATLDVARKVEMLKARAKFVSQQNWRKPIVTYLDKIETVWKCRNIAAHTPLIPDDKHGAVFAVAPASKLLKNLKLEHPTAERIPIGRAGEAIKIGEQALGQGEEIIQNFKRLNEEREKRFGSLRR